MATTGRLWQRNLICGRTSPPELVQMRCGSDEGLTALAPGNDGVMARPADGVPVPGARDRHGDAVAPRQRLKGSHVALHHDGGEAVRPRPTVRWMVCGFGPHCAHASALRAEFRCIQHQSWQ